MREAIESFAERIGRDPLLIQAAGGNVSWKDDGVLWVKSSGAWLADASTRDIFVPVDLAGVRDCVDEGRESYVDFRIGSSSLRPSIETALHALMPQTVVAHLHSVDAIAFAVLRDGCERLGERLRGLDWMWVPYRKPGAPLASRIAAQLRDAASMPDVLMLANHGIVVCGPDVDAIDRLAENVAERLRLTPRPAPSGTTGPDPLPGYTSVNDATTASLAFDAMSLQLLRERWVMYPDHAVFLGPAARVFPSVAAAAEAVAREVADERALLPCVIVPGHGVWLDAAAPRAAMAMLDCYARVCLRVGRPDGVVPLTDADIAALLDWEAEKYRKHLAQSPV